MSAGRTTLERWDSIGAVMLGFAGLLMAVSFAYRTFKPAADARVAAASGFERAGPRVDAWEDALPIGIQLFGTASAPVTIVEFSDLECPACRGFHETVGQLVKMHPNDVRHVFVHFPLAQHRFAVPAARALECADSAGAAGAFADAIFRGQDSLGLKSWGRFAAEADLVDTSRIASCATQNASYPRIEAGIALGNKLGIRVTPTILINGWRFDGGPSLGALDSAVNALRAERN